MMSQRLILFACSICIATPLFAQQERGELVAAAPGRIEGSGDILKIGAAVTGTVAESVVVEGQRVEAGALLARIDCRPKRHELESARHRVEETRNAFNRMEAGPREEDIAVAKAIRRRALALKLEAEERYDRFTRLKSGQSVSMALISEAKHKLAARIAEVEAAQLGLSKLQKGERTEDIEMARARHAQAGAQVRKLVEEFKRCEVRSPIKGIVLRKAITLGELVSTIFPRALFEIMKMDSMKVRAEVDERDLGAICHGQKAVVTADGYPNVSLTAAVTEVKPSMGRRTILSDDPAEKSDRDVREVLLALEKSTAWPIGLRVIVRFHKCAMDKPT